MYDDHWKKELGLPGHSPREGQLVYDVYRLVQGEMKDQEPDLVGKSFALRQHDFAFSPLHEESRWVMTIRNPIATMESYAGYALQRGFRSNDASELGVFLQARVMAWIDFMRRAMDLLKSDGSNALAVRYIEGSPFSAAVCESVARHLGIPHDSVAVRVALERQSSILKRLNSSMDFPYRRGGRHVKTTNSIEQQIPQELVLEANEVFQEAVAASSSQNTTG